MSAILTATPAGFALKTGFQVIKQLYHVAGDINTWVDEHISQMKSSENPTICRTGKVLEGAKYGFGLGYIAPVIIISLGQFLCGFTLAAGKTLVTAGALSNPVAMTCAALGAIYYGWNALSDQEKTETIERLREDLEVGAELVKSIANFVIAKTNEMLSSENLKELKGFISDSAHAFGKTLSDVTHAIKDKVFDSYQALKSTTEAVGGVVAERTVSALDTVKSVTEGVSAVAAKAGSEIADSTKILVAETMESVKSVAKDTKESVAHKVKGSVRDE